MSKLKISVVSYLNSKVFIKGLLSENQKGFDVSLDIPSVCAHKLLNNEVEIGLVPVAIIPDVSNAKVVSNYCISADGAVNSVFLFSNTLLENIKVIYLDHHSKTSNLLCKILANEFWKIKPEFRTRNSDDFKLLEGEAFVLIGDRTFDYIGKYKTQLDLAEDWKAYTGLAFVFAAWVANTEIAEDDLLAFNSLLSEGLKGIEDVIQENSLTNFDVNDYLKNRIQYELNDQKIQALNLYLEKSKLYR
jgi:chorismate dehydratase